MPSMQCVGLFPKGRHHKRCLSCFCVKRFFGDLRDVLQFAEKSDRRGTRGEANLPLIDLKEMTEIWSSWMEDMFLVASCYY